MTLAVVTGSGGLVGAQTVRMLCDCGLEVVGIDNNMGCTFFGEPASTRWQADLLSSLPGYTHLDADIRDEAAMQRLFSRHGRAVSLVVHCAAQPSHNWAAGTLMTDFTINVDIHGGLAGRLGQVPA